MNKSIKATLVSVVLVTLAAYIGHTENRDKSCSYGYLLRPVISISKITGGHGPTVQ